MVHLRFPQATDAERFAQIAGENHSIWVEDTRHSAGSPRRVVRASSFLSRQRGGMRPVNQNPSLTKDSP
jgi:hypothetical protein